MRFLVGVALWPVCDCLSSMSNFFNAALMSTHKRRTFDVFKESHGLRAATMMCNSDGVWTVDTGLADPVLRGVLERGRVRVGGLLHDWGEDGNYTTDPPRGFWPDYTRAVGVEMSRLAARSVVIEWVLQPDSNLLLEDLAMGRVDMTDLHFLQSALLEDNATPRLVAFEPGCPTASTPKLMHTHRDAAFESFYAMFVHLDRYGGTVGVLTDANEGLISPILPSVNVEYVVIPHEADLISAIEDGEVIGAFTTGQLNSSVLVSTDTPITAIHGPFFARRAAAVDGAARAGAPAALVLFGTFLSVGWA
eukprot:Polyplicarium_translucidae@DN3467_c0_g1_i1.p1